MPNYFELALPAEIAYNEKLLSDAILVHLGKSFNESMYYRIVQRSIDARSKVIKVNLKIEIGAKSEQSALLNYQIPKQNVSAKPSVLIVGAGPAGLFAALRCIELGFKPIVFERGQDVRARRRDLAAINKEQIVNPESNYCFGEGGAGTYSDGKLYTRSNKRGDVRKILEILVAHGANSDILVDAHPHIGTNKLPALVAAIRTTIIENGGEVLFNTKVIDFIIEQNEIKGVCTHDGKEYTGLGVVLATGHSARDIFYLLKKKEITIEAKPFALGVRLEHQQSLIDTIQYHCDSRPDYLPASSYSLVTQANYKGIERGVFSFCMCPGGFIVPSATAPGEIVVNGMSPSRRDSEFANSGLVVAIELDELKEYQHHKEFACLEFQAEIERKACVLAGNTQVAPAQKMLDFVNRKVSSSLLKTSYQPGLRSMSMYDVLPPMVAERLKIGFEVFGKKKKGYLSNDAQLIGIESRTSSPVKIPRNKLDYEHVSTARLYPCGEGAGYAGGIVSAAIDGEACMQALLEKYGKLKQSIKF